MTEKSLQTEELPQTFGELVRGYRGSMTRVEFIVEVAKAQGRAKPFESSIISRWEGGESVPVSVDTLYAILTVAGVGPEAWNKEREALLRSAEKLQKDSGLATYYEDLTSYREVKLTVEDKSKYQKNYREMQKYMGSNPIKKFSLDGRELSEKELFKHVPIESGGLPTLLVLGVFLDYVEEDIERGTAHSESWKKRNTPHKEEAPEQDWSDTIETPSDPNKPGRAGR